VVTDWIDKRSVNKPLRYKALLSCGPQKTISHTLATREMSNSLHSVDRDKSHSNLSHKTKSVDPVDELWAKYSRHIPKLLRSQILTHLVNQFLHDRNAKVQNNQTTSVPLIQRFHGALLFVDISGFTALSLKLDVDTLKNHINNYFSKMLCIVEKWGGDVIKFAGDALFIVWPTDIHSKQLKCSNNNTNSPRGKKGKSSSGIRSSMMRIIGGKRASNTANNNEADNRFAAAAKATLEKAVACGLEICIECGHYEIQLKTETSKTQAGMLGKLTHWLVQPKINPEMGNPDVAYLDVHAGVSIGLMAACDIGFRNRWEYFILGEPLKSAAEAEGRAGKGQIVLSPTAHYILHRSEKDVLLPTLYGDHDLFTLYNNNDQTQTAVATPNNGQQPQPSKTTLACGCVQLEDHFYCISKIDIHLPNENSNNNNINNNNNNGTNVSNNATTAGNISRARSKSKINLQSSSSDNSNDATNMSTDLEIEVDKMLTLSRNAIHKEFVSVITKYLTNSSAVSNEKELHRKVETLLSELLTGNLRDLFQAFVRSHLLRGISNHVHDIIRDVFSETVMKQKERLSESGLHSWLISPLTEKTENTLTMPEVMGIYENYGDEMEKIDSILDERLDSKIVKKHRKPSLSKFNKGLSTQLISDKVMKAAEIRTVIVLFMKIEGLDLDLFVDSSDNRASVQKPVNTSYEMYRFLDRTDNEVAADEVLALKFHKCIAAIVETLNCFNGQLRQFIVDDKGTVAIASFGLRGSVGADNAAAAIEAADEIIQRLIELNLSASIGITTGKAYCGLVGSTNRHEFAIMGPSTNLSARLMAKTAPNSITCDADTKNSDRTHTFEYMGEITAKGYAQPVQTYQPILHANLAAPRFDGGVMSMIQHFSIEKIGHSSKKLLGMSFSQGKGSSQAKLLTTGAEPGEEFSGSPLVRDFAQSRFYISVKNEKEMFNRNSFRPNRQIKLFERQQIIYSLLSFLFPNEEASTTSKRSNKMKDLTTQENRMFVCCSTGGLGKTALLKSIALKGLSYVINSPETFNFLIIQNQVTGINSKLPFMSWKKVFLELMSSISWDHLENNNTKSSTAGKRSSSHSSNRSKHSIKSEYDTEILDHLFSQFLVPALASEKKYVYKLLTENNSTSMKEFETTTRTQIRTLSLILFELLELLLKNLNKAVIYFM
jgi:class 3 adenylate cyclase